MDRQYKKSPITEVLIDIQVDLPEKDNLSLLKSIQEEVKDSYPELKIKTEWKASFKVQDNKPNFASEASGNSIGYMFSSSNLKKMIQTTLYGYTFNMLQAYPEWNSFKQDAKSGWDIYKKAVKPLRIKRIALKYINKINIISSSIDLKEYFLTTPEIASSLPQGMTEFFMRLVMPDENQNVAIITQTVDKSKPVENNLPIIFDIDVFKIVNLEKDNQEIWDILDNLHKYAVKILEESLTEKTKQLFN